MNKKLCLSIYGELYVIDLHLVVYLQADDHYTIVYYSSGTHFMVPFGLSKVETAIAEIDNEQSIVRLSRKYMVNIRCIFHINVINQIIQLSGFNGECYSLHLPKPVLRNLIDKLNSQEEAAQA